ncbi:hypothetical protein LguiB_015426 [Lonicera macranthoides]
MAIDSASSTLAPGFRFHPTDEELVRYYLRRKICGKPFRFDAISEIDIYKVEPWDLPGKSRLKSRDLEWYFFSFLDKKYGNGSKTNRATDRGYWKTTGKDRAVYHRTQVVGMKKTLVYHSGRAPRGERTNWVMHEYRLVDEDLGKSGILQDAFVLCRVFRKSGSGPKNGEQYGAPFIEEEWEDEELVMVPKDESAYDGAYLDENDLEQILGTGNPCEDSPPLNICYGDNGNCAQESTDVSDDTQKLLVGMGENHSGLEQPDDHNLFDLPLQYDMDANSVKHEYIGEPSNNANSADVDFLLDEPFLDATDNLQSNDGAFLETNDLKHPVEADPPGFGMLDDYLTFFDANDDNTPYMTFDPSDIMGSEGLLSDPTFFTSEYLTDGTQQVDMGKQQLFEGHDNDVASSSQQEEKIGSETMCYKRASCILGDINAPPAFASEFPTKEAALHLNSTSSPLHVTAGMIQMRNLTLSGNGIDLSFSKHGQVDIILSFGLTRGDEYNFANSQSKAYSAVSRGWFCFMFIWVMVLSLSFKIGSYICAR